MRLGHPNMFWKQISHLDFLKGFISSLQKPKHPTTGIIAITLAFHICHEVHLAGFKYNFSDLRSPLHYYGNATMSLMNKVTIYNIGQTFDF